VPTAGKIPIVALRPASVGSSSWRSGGVLQVTVVVKATFAMVHEGNARIVEPAPIVTADCHRGGAGTLLSPSDLAPFLPNAGVMLWGHAQAPRPVPAVTVRLAVFRERAIVDKALHVFGDRASDASSPQPFQTMPLDYERAFGGPACADNPAGTGDPPDPRRLPNVVHPADPRRPAGFGPIASGWGPRRRFLGPRGAPVVEEHGPEIPEGFDFRWFQAAPADQQCDAFTGDEWIVVDGMHPTLPRLQTRLPGMRAEVVRVVSDPSPEGRPVALRADTLLIDADHQICSVLWRGHFSLDRAELLPAVRLVASLEMPGYPIVWPEDAHLDAAPSSTDAPTESNVVAPRVGPPDPLAQTSSVVMGPWSGEHAAILPFKPAADAPLPPVPAPGFAPRGSLGDTRAAVAPFMPALPFAPAPREAPPPEPAPAPPPVEAAPAGAEPPPAPPAAQPSGIGAIVLARIKAREPLLDLDLVRADLRGLDLGGAVLARMNLEGATLSGCKLVEARLAGAHLTGADLRGADLSHADLSHAELARAALEGTRFDGALMADANLAGAQGVGASFAAVTAARASFARGRWDEASFAGANAPGADFTAASLSGARLEKATLFEARLDDVRAAGAVFDDARLEHAHGGGAELRGASLRRVDAAGSSWEKAMLDGASFAGANLKEASLARASCVEASFAGADLSGANLQHVLGDGADLRDARLGGADLRQAKLPRASFQRAGLREISAGKANLEQARFDHADLQGSNLRGARLAGASFAHAALDGADLRDADLSGVNVFGASRKTAKLGPGARGLTEVDPGES
jgi:uncharacterized protein YjbI with pentapeptide repeats